VHVLGGAVPESLSTEVAGVGLVPRVSQHVCLQLVHSGESFVTVVARVWLFASVGHLMVLQLLISPELFVTIRALIVPRRSTGVVVQALVLVPVVLSPKTFSTQSAKKIPLRFVMGIDMQKKAVFACKSLATNFTLERFVSRVHSLLVVIHGRGGTKRFLTL